MFLLIFGVAFSLEISTFDEKNNDYKNSFASQNDLLIWADRVFLKYDGISKRERADLLILISRIPDKQIQALLKILNHKSDLERISFLKNLLKKQEGYYGQYLSKGLPEVRVVNKHQYAKKKQDLGQDEDFLRLFLKEIESLYQKSDQ